MSIIGSLRRFVDDWYVQFGRRPDELIVTTDDFSELKDEMCRTCLCVVPPWNPTMAMESPRDSTFYAFLGIPIVIDNVPGRYFA